MLDRLLRGLSIAGTSFGLLRVNPQLVVFPLISMTALGTLLLTIGRSIAVAHETQPMDAAHVMVYLGFYVMVTFISVFFNAALVACVRDALAGERVSLCAGLDDAVARMPQILGWAAFAATIGLVLAMLRDALRRLGVLGAIAGGAAEFSWAIMTYMAVPVLVIEGRGPVQCLERSVELIRTNWGKAVGVETGIGLLYGLSFIPVLLALMIAAAEHVPLAIAAVASAIYLPVVLGGIAALDMIFRTGVYFYATTGEMPLALEKGLIHNFFK